MLITNQHERRMADVEAAYAKDQAQHASHSKVRGKNAPQYLDRGTLLSKKYRLEKNDRRWRFRPDLQSYRHRHGYGSGSEGGTAVGRRWPHGARADGPHKTCRYTAFAETVCLGMAEQLQFYRHANVRTKSDRTTKSTSRSSLQCAHDSTRWNANYRSTEIRARFRISPPV
ncbi:hypothetical protein OSTOST_20633, partial [Ostertagia ostertagi]